ncbi:MAG: GyrI-like domain-containing protein [Calditrichaeota bacterium]|nr:GyrI-like domain-containing protein [Calditrichota bacterium]
MIPRIENLEEKQLIGIELKMSMTNNRTSELWRTFIARRAEIKKQVHSDLFSLQVFDADYFKHFNPANEFVKWALVEVEDFEFIPKGLAKFILEEGLYAVFDYKGHPRDGAKFFTYIFTEWLPTSKYRLDQRPHFERLGAKYKNDSSESEEEIWIPIRIK